MLVRKSCCFLVLAMAITGCDAEVEAKGSSDWMLGTFSTTFVGDDAIGLTSLGHYEFREDGTLTLIALVQCAKNHEQPAREYNWSRAGDSLVIVELPEGDVFEEWRVTPGVTCETLQVDQIQHGNGTGGPTLWRGALCMKELPPCGGVECPGCETIWCDEPPPPCDE